MSELLRKIKKIAVYLTDKKFRGDLHKIEELTKNRKVFFLKEIPYNKIKFGHRLIHYSYVVRLIEKEKQSVPLIQVTKDGQFYRIVNGNHHYIPLMIKALKTNGKILCEVIS